MNNKAFWARQAKIKGSGAVCFDPGINDLGNNAIIPHLNGVKNVLDIGCGNGTTLLYLAQKFPDINFLGIDYIPEKMLIFQKMDDGGCIVAGIDRLSG